MVAVNTGGPAVSTGGVNYLADQYFSGGNTFQVSSAIGATTDDVIYQNVRYGANFSYAVPLANGIYDVKLQFAEVYFNAAGQRVFDVTAEGALVINDLDVWSAAGGQFLAKDFVVPVTVQDGVLNLQFTASVENASINAIQITPSASDTVLVAQSGGATAVAEGGATDTLSLSLTSQPTANVTVTVAGGADVSAAPTTLTFTAANWNTSQTVTLAAVDDALVEGAETASVSFTTSSSDARYNNLSLAPVSVAVSDNDQPSGTIAVAVNAGGPAVSTGGVNYLADQYFSGGSIFQVSSAIGATTDDVVYQTERFGANFSYAVPLANGSYDVKLQFAEIYFNAAGQRVFDVTAEGALVIDDLDVWSAAGGQFLAKDFVVPVTVQDGVLNLQFAASVNNAKIAGIQVTPASDTVSVAPSGGSTAVAEGGAVDTLSLSLTSQPTANVTVTVSGGADVSAAPTTLTFTSANWNTPQTVTLAAVDDALVEGAETASVSFTTSSSDARYNNLSLAPVSVAVSDNDQPAATLSVVQSGGSTAVAEGGATDTLTLSLSSQPTSNVTVTVGGGADVSAAPATLTFTSANWSTPQTVTLAAVDDALVEGAETASVSFTTSSSDARYNNLSLAPVSVAVSDNDQPSGTTAVAVNAGGPAVSTGGVNYLADQYFSGGNTYQVSSAIGATTDDVVYQNVRYGANFSYAVPLANGSYDVKLQFAEVYFNAAGQRVFDVTAEGALVINDLDVWSAAGGQFLAKDFVVPVTVQDGVLNLQFTASVENASINAIQITPSASDTVLVAQSGGASAVAEGGATDTLSLSLSSQPTANVTVTVAGGADVSAAPTTLTFTAANWNTSQTVTLAAVDDALVEGAETASVSFTTSSSDARYNNLSLAPVSVAVSDNDQPSGTIAVAVNAGGPAVSTGGVNYLADQYFSGGSIFQVSSAIGATTDDVVYQTERFGANFSYAVPLANGSYDVKLQFAEIYFNAAGQRVFDVTAEGALVIDDLDVWSAAGGQFLAKDFVVPVTVQDGVLNLQFAASVNNAKIAGIQVTPASDTVSVAPSGGSTAVAEGGATDTLSLSLTSQPTANVTVTVSGGADVSAAPTTLTFTSANWNTPQTVTLAAVDDALLEGTETASVSFTTSSSDARYNNLSLAPVSVAVSDNEAAPAFDQSTLFGLPDAQYTSLQFGPDNRLYLSQVDGTILALQVEATASGYQVASGGIETITAIKSITNYNDNGALAPANVQGSREVTGIVVTSDPSAPTKPVLYVSSSDPRIGAGPSGGDVNLDTNSGVVSKLTQNSDGSWTRVDLVRGLPRSEENHAVNGMALSDDGHTLYLAVGGNTNSGAPSNNFAYLPEYAYSGAILSIDLATIEAMPTKTDVFGNTYKYNLPTLPPGPTDPYPDDPFGGRDGLSQAKIVVGGPVQVYSPGYRNPYDIVMTEAGKLYTIDNGANSGWGGVPAGEGTANVTNAPVNGGSDTPDHLHLVTQGFYAGHPNPVRANPAGAGWYLDGSTTPVSPPPPGWPPVPTANPVEGDFLQPGLEDGALYAGWLASTNGLTEYTASTFGGVMQGDLLTVGFDDQLYRVELSPDGASVLSVTKLTGGSAVFGGGTPLDVTAQGDGEPFAGAIFVANYGGGVTIFTPTDQPPPPPTGDADADGLIDAVDRFAEDPANGKGTDLAAGQTLQWSFSQNIDPPGPNAILNMGFTGLMSNGVDSYLTLYDPTNIKPGGAAAGFQVEQVSAGDALQSNSQENGFQFGVDVQPDVSRFVVEVKIDNPFGGDPSTSPTNFKSQGFFIGSGDQSNYLKIVAAANGGAGGIQVAQEVGGAFTAQMYSAAITGASIQTLDTITLRLMVDVDLGAATPSWEYTVGGVVSTGSGAAVTLQGDTLSALLGSFSVAGQPSALAVGIISTSFGSGETYPAFWEYMKITADPTTGGMTASQASTSTFVMDEVITDAVLARSGYLIARAEVTTGDFLL